jgi:ribonuclease HI
MHFPMPNNVAEYEALLHGLRIATALGIQQLKVLGGSLLNKLIKNGRALMRI